MKNKYSQKTYLVLAILFCIVLSSCNSIIIQKNKVETGILTDARDGQNYPWVQLKDGKKWMAKNLNYLAIDSWCYDNDDKNCDKYGRLYTWDSVKNSCPEGWRLPSKNEWQEMIELYGGLSNKVYKKSFRVLRRNAFSAEINGGYRSPLGKFYPFGGAYWSSTNIQDNSKKWGVIFNRHFNYLNLALYSKKAGISCRCIQD